MVTNKEISESRTFIMGLAMIAIMIFHNSDIGKIPILGPLKSLYGYLGVDLFLFVSGFGLVYSLNKNTIRQFFINRVTRILPACFIAGMIILFIDNALRVEKITSCHPIFRVFSLQKWYIQAILIYYPLSPILRKVLLHYSIKALCIIIIGSLIGCLIVPNIDFFKLSWIINRFPVFCIGMYVGIFGNPSYKYKGRNYINILFLLLTLFLLAVGNGDNLGKLALILWAVNIPLITEYLITIKNWLADRGNLIIKLVEILGIYSLEIYLLHEYIYWVSYKIETIYLRLVLIIMSLFLTVYIVQKLSEYLKRAIFLQSSKKDIITTNVQPNEE